MAVDYPLVSDNSPQYPRSCSVKCRKDLGKSIHYPTQLVYKFTPFPEHVK